MLLHRIGSSIVQTTVRYCVVSGGTASCPRCSLHTVVERTARTVARTRTRLRAFASSRILKANIQDVQFKVFIGRISFLTVFPAETCSKNEKTGRVLFPCSLELIVFQSDIKSQRLRHR